ncbi:Rpn family recombination-promoting nuclease/putative transposase [Paenibacillus sp. MZ04-78.2]|uniref:Rpn family recombination-promoting nuclease/putative transposase n=1 Tax=Paenibacillus sp. MZ04-78.2 TaxID=2962034 RepID=UPI0020B6A3F3|nr:Rpn family recombination-promoting nuclease/putative transposase [Paenibacillus sp. MZ04-78.2]MCP3776046.1 Rpn family recombination-promoting nuclease/putative transposase [Paenibacillus sp. MZ04-78.2]
MTELLEPSVDFVFKQIFGSEENKDEVLLNFLNEALRETEPKPFVSLTLLNPQLDKNALTDKQAILDVRAQNEDGKQVNLEIQVSNKYDMPKRSLYYAAKMYEEQLGEGQFYKSLKKVISINILTFNQIANDRFHNIYHLREDHTGELLLDDIEIHFMELPKLNLKPHKMDDRLVNWLMFIDGAPQERWEELAMDTPGLKKAMTTLEFLSQNKEARALYEMRKKALLDEQSALDYAESRGRAEGKTERDKEIATSMLQKGLPVSLIVEVTGLSETEIEALNKKLH